MKKYLITGITALVMCIGFTSCSHDMTPMSQEEINAAKAQQIVDKYNNAFIAKFGQPAANQDWGFCDNAASRALTRGARDYSSKGSLEPTGIFFPEDFGADTFTMPDGVKPMPNDQGGAGPYYIDENTTQVDSWSSQCVIYVMGNVDLANKAFSVNIGTKIYLMENSTLNLGAHGANGLNVAFYIAKNATLETTEHLKMQTYPVYNHGTIKVGSFELCSGSLLYNVGSLETIGDVKIDNSTCYIVNDGEIKSGSVHVEGQGSLQNNAEWIVTGTTVVNCDNGGWVNNGHWTTQNYAYTGGSENVINNCFLEVTNDFDMNISSEVGAFKMDSGCGVLTKNFYGGRDTSSDPIATSGPYKIVMGEASLFKVTGTATLEGGNPGWGFFGPSTGKYAVFQAKNIVRNSEHEGTQGAVTYSGNLYVSAETHFAKGHDGQDAEGHYFINEWGGFEAVFNIFAEGFNSGIPSVDIEETLCCPGFKGEEDDEFDVRIIGEDLTPGDTDWDFNDVVFGVKFNDADNGAACTLLAAGGTLPLRIATKGNPDLNNANDWVEVHSLFGVSTTTMVNTGGVSTTVDLKPTFDVTGISKTENGRDIKIYVNKGTKEEPNWIELTAVQGAPAAKLAVRQGFTICKERQNINEKYERFKDWVSNPLIRWY